jgi:copper transport protein
MTGFLRYQRTGRRLVVAALALLVPATAHAHGRLKSSVPSAGSHLATVPRELRLDFSESPDLTFSSVRLAGPDGREVPVGAMGYAVDSHRSLIVPIAGAMRPGTYTIIWQMAGDDGHPVRGRIEFVIAPGAMGLGIAPAGVAAIRANGALPAASDTSMAGMHHDPVSMPEGNGFGAESAVYVLIRWVQFVALLLAIGAVTFHSFVLAFIRRDPSSAAQPDEPALLAAVESRAASVGHLAAIALAATLLARLAAQSYAMHGGENPFDPALMGPMIGKTMWGWGWLLQLAGILLAGVGFHRARAERSARAGAIVQGPTHLWWRLAGAGAVLLAFSPGLSSHASAAPRLRALAVLADGLHVLGASSWLGTLSVVLFAGLSVAVTDGSARGGAFVRDLINAFSPVALVSAGIAATTGVFAAWLHVGTVPNLWGTRYGITLLVKLGILSVVALTGFYNWRFVQPRLGTPEATAHLRRSARVEVAVAVLVLLATAILVASPTSMDATM